MFRLAVVSFLLLAAGGCGMAGEPGSGMPLDPGMMERHMAPIPAEYANLSNPVAADSESLARGQAVYDAHCAVCHGEGGWGDGPAAANLTPPPASLAHTAPMMPDAYLFYRVSDGGGFAPFNSAMPAWKATLSETERWDVINYARSLDGDGMMGGGGMMNGMPGWMWLWMLAGGVLLIAVIVVIVVAIALLAGRSGSSPAAEAPLAILKRRLASGEITTEEFETMKRQLEET